MFNYVCHAMSTEAMLSRPLIYTIPAAGLGQPVLPACNIFVHRTTYANNWIRRFESGVKNGPPQPQKRASPSATTFPMWRRGIKLFSLLSQAAIYL